MNVEVVQRRLWEQSQKHRQHRESSTPLFPINKYDGRVRNLMDLMHQPQWIAAACDRVLERSRGKAMSRFASYKQATTLENLQTLCLECHKLKTYRSNQDSLESRMQ